MRVAHFDCFSGISGDMVLGAAFDAGVPVEPVRAMLAGLGLPLTLEVTKVKRCGFAATKATVVAKDEEDYRFLPDVEAIIGRAAMTDRQRQLATAVFRRLAEAEAKSHGMPLEKVHFHEVGALDSIADILGAAVALDLLGVERFTASPVPTGIGTVKGAHGLMPVPAPGTAELLKGVPLAPSDVKFELTTPTGAAILTTVAAEYTASPAMTVEAIGHGAGTKDFLDRPNILRLLVGTAAPAGDTVTVLETNLDDVSGEVIGYAAERLFAAGALDVYHTAVQMKKGRPGVLVGVICSPASAPALEAILFRETGTLGVRRHACTRTVRPREAGSADTPWGPVRVKRAAGPEQVTPEYDDAARVAREHGVPLRDVYAAVSRAGAGPTG
jgi:hypothetical protein